MEATVQAITFTLKYLLCYLRLKLFICHQDGDTTVVKSSTTSSTTHLDVFTASNPPKLVTVEFFKTRKHDRFSWHVNSHRKSFSSEKHFEESLLEKQLNNFFYDWKEATVMNANTSL